MLKISDYILEDKSILLVIPKIIAEKNNIFPLNIDLYTIYIPEGTTVNAE